MKRKKIFIAILIKLNQIPRMTAINQNIFNDRGVKLYLIEYGAYLVAFLVSGLILSIWQ
jgi:hypothetical protein